jgi:ADP-L-glycero-D-manno-heptose 6-epimerase
MTGSVAVTGGAGFVGANLIAAVGRATGERVLVVEDLERAHLQNLDGLEHGDCIDWRQFPARLSADPFRAVIHLGAITDTRVQDWSLLSRRNVDFPKRLLSICLTRRIPLLYASSAAVYASGARGEARREGPINPYGRSKLAFDQAVRAALPTASSQVVGLRYFNLYGRGEAHKGAMASMVRQLDRQCRARGKMPLFEGSGGFGDGEQSRDFVSVDDAVAVTLWFLEHPERSGIFDVGTGMNVTFNAVAQLVAAHHGRGEVRYFPMPEDLRGSYQHSTRAELGPLREAGYPHPFRSVDTGVPAYLDALDLEPDAPSPAR